MKEKQWLKSARVRVTQLARTKYSRKYAKEEVALTKRYGCNTLVFFVEMDGWLLYPSKYTERDITVRNHDLVGEIRQECKKHNIRFVAPFMCMHCQTYHLRKHPDWCLKHHSSLFPDSSFAGHKRASQGKDVMSLHSPYRDYLLGAVGELLERCDPDGVYFDGLYCPPGYDYSKWSVKKFEQRFGRDVPSDYFDPDWVKWSLSQAPDFCRDVAALLNCHNPRTALIVDCHGPTMACIDSGENVLESCRHVDAFIQECYFEHSGEHPAFVAREALALAAETRRPVWCARWLTRSPGHVSVCEPKAMALNWFCDTVATGSVPTLIDQDAFWHDRTLEKPMKRVCTQYAKLRRLIGDSEPISHVAVFHSINRKFERLQEDVLTARAPHE